MTEADSSAVLKASLSLSASLLEAHNREAVLRAFMRVGCEALGADGCLFMPFGEFSNALAPQEFGHVPLAPSGDWTADLFQPATRVECKTCQARQAGRECVLLRADPIDRFVRCVPLRREGREAGLFSFVFASHPSLGKEIEAFLPEALRLVDLALDAVERVAQERMAFDHSMELSKSDDVRALLPEIEYRAVLGERTRLAREIHDGLAQTLAFLKIEINRAEAFLSQGKADGAARLLHDSARAVSDAYLDARQAIENLRRVPDGRLDSWLRQVAEDYEALTGQCVDVSISLIGDFPPNAQVQMIRVVQEALANVRKHAQAENVWLSAWESEGEALIEVRDDGRGFALTDSVAAARFGLRGMRERAEAIGADFQVESCPRGGTTVRLRIPLGARAAK
ncbi:MAG: sensor histidine kinase [Chloroflexota bacterium]